MTAVRAYLVLLVTGLAWSLYLAARIIARVL